MKSDWTTSERSLWLPFFCWRLVRLWQSALFVESLNRCWDPVGNAAEPCWW